MPKLSSTQLFVVVLVALALLGAAVYLDRTYLPVGVAVVLSILGVGGAQHASAAGAANVVQGVNLGVPLVPASPPAAPAASEQVVHAPIVQGANG